MHRRNSVLVQAAVIAVGVMFCSSVVGAGEWKRYSWDNEFGPPQPTRGVRIDSVDGQAALVILRMPRFHRGTVDVHLAPRKKALKRIAGLQGFQARDRPTLPVAWRIRDGQLRKLRTWRQDGGLRFEIAEETLQQWKDAASLELTYKKGAWEFELSGITAALDRLFAESKLSDQVPYAGFNGTTSPTVIRNVAPSWPPGEALYKGVVRVLLIVGLDGSPRSIAVWRSTLPRHSFHQAALEAASQLRFAPALRDGVPVEVYYEAFMDFGVDSNSQEYLQYTGD